MKIRHQNKKVVLMKTLVFSFAFLLGGVSFAQQKRKNLVPNPSFEVHKGKSNVIINAIPWQNEGTVDYFMKPEKRDTSLYKGAHSGTCYAGLRFQSAYKEYMFVELEEPLEKDRIYNFKMYVRLLSNSTVVVKQLGVYFSDDRFKVGMVFDAEGLIDSTYKKGISSQKWLPIQGDYIAHGGERYIIIGNFTTKMKEDFVKKNKWDFFEFKEAYYYIDDVSLYKGALLNPIRKGEKKVIISPDSLQTGKTFELPNLQFEKGTANIARVSYKMMDEFVKIMNNHPFMEIQINAYTDNVDNESNNKKLSKERAKAVYDYLYTHSIISPITYQGLGSLQPIAPNDTDENRALNNRVEIVIIKK